MRVLGHGQLWIIPHLTMLNHLGNLWWRSSSQIDLVGHISSELEWLWWLCKVLIVATGRVIGLWKVGLAVHNILSVHVSGLFWSHSCMVWQLTVVLCNHHRLVKGLIHNGLDRFSLLPILSLFIISLASLCSHNHNWVIKSTFSLRLIWCNNDGLVHLIRLNSCVLLNVAVMALSSCSLSTTYIEGLTQVNVLFCLATFNDKIVVCDHGVGFSHNWLHVQITTIALSTKIESPGSLVRVLDSCLIVALKWADFRVTNWVTFDSLQIWWNGLLRDHLAFRSFYEWL